MMMRLILLARALQNREVGQNTTDSDGHADVDEGDGTGLADMVCSLM